MQQWHNGPANGNQLLDNQPVKFQSGTNSDYQKEMDSALDLHKRQMEEIEHSVVETKAASQQNMILMNNRIAVLNNTIRDMRRLLTDHNVRASDAFEDVGGRVMDFNTRIQHNDDR